MFWRLAARAVTGPVAFLVGGLIDVLAYAVASARARLSREAAVTRARLARRRR